MNLIDKRELLNERPELLNPNMNDEIDCIMPRLVNKDCLEYMKTLPNSSIDLILTDPPYNIALGIFLFPVEMHSIMILRIGITFL